MTTTIVKLTREDTGEPEWVNVAHIVRWRETDAGGSLVGTTMQYGSANTFRVTESPGRLANVLGGAWEP